MPLDLVEGLVLDADVPGHLVRQLEHAPLLLAQPGLAALRLRHGGQVVGLHELHAGLRDAGLHGQRGVVAPLVPGAVADGHPGDGDLADRVRDGRLRAHRGQERVPAVGHRGRVQECQVQRLQRPRRAPRLDPLDHLEGRGLGRRRRVWRVGDAHLGGWCGGKVAEEGRELFFGVAFRVCGQDTNW